jgi:5-methylcytosine-specific restriction protein A
MPRLPKGRGRVKPVDKNKSWGGDTSVYRKKRWRQLRAFWIQGSPLCVECEQKGRTVVADVVDHIRPVKQWAGGMYDMNNLQSLCHSCHNRKTYEENKGIYGEEQED